MIKSMTGFGKAEGTVNKKRVCVEIRSLNSKGMDLNMRLPGVYREKELDIRNFLAGKLERGKIDFTLNVEFPEGSRSNRINKSVVKSYYAQLSSISRELKEEKDDLMEIIMRLPDVLKAEKEELNEAEWKKILKVGESAIDKLDTFRKKEGLALEKELKGRINLILGHLAAVEKMDKERIPGIKQKLREELQKIIDEAKIDVNRFEQELIYYLEKLDITEEKVRLKTHCDFFIKTMNEDSSGKKLGFIAQEIGREINTIGSKANDAGIQKTVVQMKDELEKIKEQLNNVL